MPASLHRLIYCSRPRPGALADHVADEIGANAAEANRRRGVTGLLMTHPDWFLQVLEGRRTELSDLVLRIANDPRHTGLQFVAFEPIPRRTYADWGLAVARYYEALWLEVGGGVARHVGFDPFGADAGSLTALMTQAGRRLRVAT